MPRWRVTICGTFIYNPPFWGQVKDGVEDINHTCRVRTKSVLLKEKL